MPDSFPSALNRLKGIERKMSRDPGYSKRYSERVDHLLNNDFATELKETQRTQRTWYLPHFGVDNVNKKRLRLVFDAAATSEGLCLNDYLLKGPDLLNSLLGIMLRFREHSVGVTGDIKDMFLRVKIQPQDQDALRFLWRSRPTEPVKTYVMTSLIFGANCAPFVAQFIKNKNASRYESSMPAAVDAIVNSHYVDDYIQSLPDEDTAIQMVKNVTDIHKAGGFQLCNLTSNSIAVLDSIPKETLGTVAVKFKVGQQFQGERALGLLWFPGKDELGFDVSLKRIPDSIIRHKQRPSKRIMLRVIMSIFDVFGFLSPFTVQGRIMLQDTWRLNISWDDDIPDGIYKKWCEWIELLKVVDKIRIPRWYQRSAGSGSAKENASAVAVCRVDGLRCPATNVVTQASACAASGISATGATPPQVIQNNITTTTDGYTNLSLHIFSDASTKAMSAVAYFRWIKDDEIYVAFVASKCRVAPVKPLTVPRAELQAALLAARLADTIRREHKLSAARRYFWCDSSTVLHWLNNNTRVYKAYEANRLGEIDSLTNISEWRYVPTKLNIADIATREVFNYESFMNEWFKGPQFLYSHERSWPLNLFEPEAIEVFSGHVTVNTQENMSCNLPIPDPERFSSWLRLLRSTAAVLKFILKCKKLTHDDCSLMARAELLILKQAQMDSFANEIADIKNGKNMQRDSRLLTLTPYLGDEGLLYVGGRIDAAQDVPLATKRPIILDGRHPVARLLVRHQHVKAAHGNQEAVVNDLKQKYWLLRLRPTVKYVASRCMLCRLRKAKPLIPRMGDLPAARLAHHQRCFSFCGLDLFGPMEVVVGRRREKRYGVLFTCLTVRAIHIEVVHSLTTDSLILALRRMASRRGWPSNFFSDNGTNLRGANTELKNAIKEINNEDLKKEAANNRAQWTFVPPRTPHWGGAWERLIRTVKVSLGVILKERAPKDEVLLTLLAEVENMVNGRPLTHVSVEPGSSESITPNHFLLGSSANLPIAGEFDDSDLYLRKKWRTAQRLADMYWRRWLKEFLPLLLPRKKWQQDQRPLREGDLVLIVDPDSPRNVWPRGIVKTVFPGRDGRVRVVEVTTQRGVLRRSAARVAPVPIVE
ncbi:uncharacterized protein LOC133532048 [Cydia pomonella]|uniref:uncharacterized protein LOC133532048 n=1 Tax=Cydia pomonella TaxID=82600 RepID=UPI002ADE20B0|nr:uncharacterized protein LOC133532048 [Cydia pomonella]